MTKTCHGVLQVTQNGDIVMSPVSWSSKEMRALSLPYLWKSLCVSHPFAPKLCNDKGKTLWLNKYWLVIYRATFHCRSIKDRSKSNMQTDCVGKGILGNNSSDSVWFFILPKNVFCYQLEEHDIKSHRNQQTDNTDWNMEFSFKLVPQKLFALLLFHWRYGYRCQNWASDTPHSHGNNNSPDDHKNFPDGSFYAAK